MATIRQKLSTYAITILTHQRRSHFQRTANAELFIATLFRYQDQGKFALHAFAIMPDHIHVLITPATDQSTSRCIQLIKGGYSFAVRDQSPGEIWHSGYHEHRIRDESDVEAQKQYIANNPSRKHLSDYPHVHTYAAHASRWVPSPLDLHPQGQRPDINLAWETLRVPPPTPVNPQKPQPTHYKPHIAGIPSVTARYN